MNGVYISLHVSKQLNKVNRQFMIMDHAFKLAYTIKTTTSCVVHRYNVNANTRNTHMNHENANASTSAGKRNGKKVFLHFHRTFIYTCEPGQCKHKCKSKVKKHRFHWFHVTMAL